MNGSDTPFRPKFRYREKDTDREVEAFYVDEAVMTALWVLGFECVHAIRSSYQVFVLQVTYSETGMPPFERTGFHDRETGFWFVRMNREGCHTERGYHCWRTVYDKEFREQFEEITE